MIKRFIPFKILLYQLHIFQLEEYIAERFLKAVFKKGLIPKDDFRKKFDWTTKAKVIFLTALSMQIFWSSFIVFIFLYGVELSIWAGIILWILFFYLLSINSYIVIIQSADLLFPVEFVIKQKRINKAKQKILELKKNGLIIIGVTGSYGKTTTKETIAGILSEKYKVVKTEGNNNTPLGISNTIINKLKSNTEVFVVEMGEYVKGDVLKLCQIAPPEIAVITGINEAHLERYKTMQNAIDTKFEIVDTAHTVVLNGDDKLILDSYQRFIKLDQKVLFYSSDTDKNNQIFLENLLFDQNGNGLSFDLTVQKTELTGIKVPFVSYYIIGNIAAAVIIADTLNLSTPQIRLGISKLKPFDHRMQVVKKGEIVIIDDTYNGNSTGFKAGIDVLKQFQNRRKIYITPGLVETGYLEKEIHLEIGKDLASVCDIVILIKNSVSDYIKEGLNSKGFKHENIVIYNSAKEAYSSFGKFLKEGDVVLMQNDWSDNYT